MIDVKLCFDVWQVGIIPSEIVDIDPAISLEELGDVNESTMTRPPSLIRSLARDAQCPSAASQRVRRTIQNVQHPYSGQDAFA